MPNELVVPMVGPFSSGDRRHALDYVDWRAVVAAAVAVVAAVLRVLVTGQSGNYLLIGAVLVGALLALLLVYARLRIVNSSLYMKGDRIGVSSALGTRTEVAVRDVAYLQKCSVAVTNGPAAIRLLAVMNRSGRCVLRFYGADGLQEGGIDRIASAAGVEVRGSWDESIPLDVLRKQFPGAATLSLTVSGGILQHRNLTYWGLMLVTIVALLGFTALLIMRAH